MKKGDRGFTLIELLVVMAIIGILAVAAVPALFRNINKAKIADVESDYNAIKSSVLEYYYEHGEIPYKIGDQSFFDKYIDNVSKDSPLGGSYHVVPSWFRDVTDKKLKYYTFYGYTIDKDGKINNKRTEISKKYKVTLALRPQSWNNNVPVGLPKITKAQFEKLAKDIGYDKVFIGNPKFPKEGSEIFIGLIPESN